MHHPSNKQSDSHQRRFRAKHRRASRANHCRAMSLIEVVISMGLLAVVMLPIIGLMATSRKVMIAGDTSRSGDYARQTSLDAAIFRLRSAQQVVDSGSNYVDVITGTGTTGRLSVSGGRLLWTEAGVQQTLATGLSSANFTFGTASGAPATAGTLLMLEVATQASAEPMPHWSSATIWIKPTI